MPPYINNPSGNNPVTMLFRGTPGYAYGSFNKLQQDTLMQVTNVALTGNVATVTVLVREGNIPIVGGNFGGITITGTTTAGGIFNVVKAAMTGVTINALTGVGTITFALTHANVASTPDAGQAYVRVVATGEALATGSSQAFAIQEVPVGDDNQMTITWSTIIGGAPATVTVNLQASVNDVDSEYATLDSSTNTTGETRTISAVRFRFLRLNVSAATGGTNPTIQGKILV